MVEFVELEKLAAPEQLELAEKFRLEDYIFSSQVRGSSLDYLGLSRRLVWMGVGREFIEPEILDWIDRMPRQSVMWDVGASNGIFSLYAASKGIRCVAIEPCPANFFLLSYNNYINKKNYDFCLEAVLNCAVSNVVGVGSLYIKKMELGGHQKIIDRSVDVFGERFEAEYQATVIKVTINDLIERQGLALPKFLKIDVDGMEEACLQGADRYISLIDEIFIELTGEQLKQFASQYFGRNGFTLERMVQVQRYEGLYNCIFKNNNV